MRFATLVVAVWVSGTSLAQARLCDPSPETGALPSTCEHPWRAAVRVDVQPTPRHTLEFDSHIRQPAVGVSAAVSRYFAAYFRFDVGIRASVAIETSRPEMALAVDVFAFPIITASSVMIGLGLGSELVMAQGFDPLSQSNFGWLAARPRLLGEVAFRISERFGLAINFGSVFTVFGDGSPIIAGLMARFGLHWRA